MLVTARGAIAGWTTGALVTRPGELEAGARAVGTAKPTPPPRSPASRDCVSKSAPAIKNRLIVFITKIASTCLPLPLREWRNFGSLFRNREIHGAGGSNNGAGRQIFFDAFDQIGETDRLGQKWMSLDAQP